MRTFDRYRTPIFASLVSLLMMAAGAGCSSGSRDGTSGSVTTPIPTAPARPAALTGLSTGYAVRTPGAAVSVAPNFCKGRRELGRVLLDEGRMKEALAELSSYARFCDRVPDAHLQLGLARMKAGDVPGAREAPSHLTLM